jgi:GAF domain-containing protein
MSPEWQFIVTLTEWLRPLKDPVAIQEAGVRLIGQHLGATRVNFTNIEGDEFVVRQSYVNGVAPLPPRGRVAQFGKAIVEACRRGETVAVDGVQSDSRFTDQERAALLAMDTAAFIGAPLIKGGRWLATLAVHSATPRPWTRDQVALVELTAQRTWVSGEHARAEEALGRTESRRAFLQRLGETTRPLADPTQILAETCRLLAIHLGVERVGYGEIDGDDCVMIAEHADGLPPQPRRFRGRALGASRTREILDGGTIAVNDTLSAAHAPEERAALRASGIGAYITPLLIKNGRFVGAFGVHSRSARAWTSDESDLAQEGADRMWATLEHR